MISEGMKNNSTITLLNLGGVWIKRIKKKKEEKKKEKEKGNKQGMK